MKRIPFLYERECKNLLDMEKYWTDLSDELGLEIKGLNNLTKQNITKVDKTQQNIR